MPFTLTMPKLSPTMEEGTIAQWLKKEGERVEAGDVLFEVATDKATVEYNALDEGWLRKIIVPQGQSAVVNQAVAIMTEEEKESIEGYQPEGAAAAGAIEAASQPGKPMQQPAAQPAATASSVETAAQPAKAVQQPTVAGPAAASAKGRIMASPLAKKVALQRGIDLSTVNGTGPNKRIMSRDLAHIKASAAPQPQEAPGTFTIETLSPMRKVIAQRLQEAKSTIPHFYVQHTLDAAPLLGFRAQLKELDVQVSINDCIVKACALALREHPAVNSGFNSADNTLIRYQTVDVAVAVSLEGGLITPIVQQADYKALSALSAEIKSLAKRAKEGKLSPSEYQGGSFTVSNLGMFGVTNFQAIINPPQAAILAVSGILDVPVVKDGAVVPGKTINLTLSADHRAIDGVVAAKFLNTLKKLLENPISLLLAES